MGREREQRNGGWGKERKRWLIFCKVRKGKHRVASIICGKKCEGASEDIACKGFTYKRRLINNIFSEYGYMHTIM
jgi:hypothetical protein